MKKSFLNYGLSLLAAVAMTMPLVGCSDSDDGPKSSELTVYVALPTGISAEDVENATLEFTKGDKSETVAINNVAEPTAKVVVNGKYTISFKGKIKDENYSFLLGSQTAEVYAASTVIVNVEKAIKSPLVFKTIYTTGGEEYYMKDSYWEIVNNSDEVQYLDGLIMSRIPHNDHYTYGEYASETPWQANGLANLYACGQGMVIAFPGNGTEHPLQPGESVVVANDAFNHNADHAPSPDLSKADFEVYNEGAWNEADYDAPNMDIVIDNNPYSKTLAFGMGMSSGGYVLAKLPEGMTLDQFKSSETYLMTKPGSDDNLFAYLCIPSEWVLDAVDMWDNAEEEHVGVFLAKDDAKGILGSARYTGKCLKRKALAPDANGRVYYQDTNNSANDFLNEQDPTLNR